MEFVSEFTRPSCELEDFENFWMNEIDSSGVLKNESSHVFPSHSL